MPPENRACLERSLVFAQQPEWQELVAYATETPQWRVAVYADGSNQWQMVVEAVNGDLRSACQSLWRSTRKATRGMSPRLVRLEVLDEATAQVFLRGSVGVFPQVRRRELWLPLLVGLANCAIFVISGADSATLRGAIPGLVAGTIASVILVSDSIRKSLVWHP